MGDISLSAPVVPTSRRSFTTMVAGITQRSCCRCLRVTPTGSRSTSIPQARSSVGPVLPASVTQSGGTSASRTSHRSRRPAVSRRTKTLLLVAPSSRATSTVTRSSTASLTTDRKGPRHLRTPRRVPSLTRPTRMRTEPMRSPSRSTTAPWIRMSRRCLWKSHQSTTHPWPQTVRPP